MGQTKFSKAVIALHTLSRVRHNSCQSGLFRCVRYSPLLAVLFWLLMAAPALRAYPVSYSVTGTFATPALSGPDALKLAGKSFSISATIDSLAACCPYTTTITVQAGSLPAVSGSAQVTLSAGNPGSITVTGAVSLLGVSIPFAATALLPLGSSLPYPFASESIVASGSTATYGNSGAPTILGIASGTASAAGTAPPLTAATGSLSFNYQIGGTVPPSQTDTVTATGANLSLSATTNSGGNWLTVSPSSGASSVVLTISASPGSLAVGTYTGAINVTSLQAANNLSIPVTLSVTQVSSAFTASPSSLSFAYQTGGSPPGSQNLTVGASPAASIAFTASASTTSGGNWLAVNPGSGTTSGIVTISVNPAGLNPGAYSGSIAISGGATNSPLSVPVTLTVTAVLSANPTSLAFSYQTGGSAPASQSLHISASGSVTLNVNAAASGGNWLSVSPAIASTPSDLTISVNPTGLSAGTYNGSITVSSLNASNNLSVPVTLSVSSQPLLSVTPTTLTFPYQLGSPTPSPQILSISGTGSSSLSYTVVAAGGGWLSAGPAGGNTPGSVTVSVNPSGLSSNTYNGTITITAAGAENSPVVVQVVLQVAAQTTITVSPSQLQFLYQVSGTAPASQPISVTSVPVGVAITATASGGNWLSVGPSSAVAPAAIGVSVNPAGLSPGTYSGTVSISGSGAANNPQTVAVTFLVSAPSSLTATPGSLTFTAPSGSTPPASQTVAIASKAAAQNFTVAASVPWLSATPASGGTPAKLTVSVNPSGLASGSYTGVLTVTPTISSNGPLNIPVSFTVSGPAPVIDAITDAASETSLPLYQTSGQSTATSPNGISPGAAPGSIVSIWGTAIGPDQPLSLQLASDGLVSTTLDNTSVMINGEAAPLLMVSQYQINAVVPFKVAGLSVLIVKVVRNGVASNTLEAPVVYSAPALFTTEESGKGQGAILNQDGSTNSASNPAAKGSVIVLYGEGAGQSNPPGEDGTITGTVSQFPVPILPVTVEIGGQPATVRYAGAAPGLIAGALQVNVVIPSNVASGNIPVVVKVGEASSQLGVTVAVQ
jgi:uncharacterized protein (TIGR03437 family)